MSHIISSLAFVRSPLHIDPCVADPDGGLGGRGHAALRPGRPSSGRVEQSALRQSVAKIV
jgi:hypothetical protein